MVTAIVILAAGSSSRMGQPKQLLTYQGKTLLEHTTEAALSAATGPVTVVLGAHADEILARHTHPEVSYTINKNWQQGMSSSIFSGLSAILNHSQVIDNVIITVADQPFTDQALFLGLLSMHRQTGKGIIASSYSQTMGTPVLFNRKYFDLLLALNDQQGAKSLLTRYAYDVQTVPFEKGYIDIDTKTDYTNLLNQQAND